MRGKYLFFTLLAALLILTAVVSVLRLPKTPATMPPGNSVTTNTVNQSPQARQSPAAAASNFYAWYIRGIMQNQTFSTSPEFKSSIGEWLTPEFTAHWQSIIASTDSDPALLAQDYQPSWSSHIASSIADQTQTTSSVRVSLGSASELHVLLVHLVWTNNQWLIASVEPAS